MALKWLFLLVSIRLFSQALPPVQNYAPLHYNAENQNWGVSQAVDKKIYVANNGGLLAFNGAVWKLYPSPNGSIIRSVKAIEDRIYTGCYMEFGFWEKDKLGQLQYHSLTTERQVPLIEDEQFWNILHYEDWVLFQSLERIYMFNTADGSLEIVDSKSTRARIFKLKNEVFFQKVNHGLYKIEHGAAILVSDHPVVRENIIIGMMEAEDMPLLLTEQGSFYFLKEKELSPWNISWQPTNIYSSLQLNDGSIILGTISDGMYQIDITGKTLQHINKVKGLNDNTVLALFEDHENNLWLGLDNGVSVINMNSPFTEFRDEAGKLGVVYAAKIFEDNLYLGTNQGLFIKNMQSQDDTFRLIPDTEGQVWCLREIKGLLFCGHNKGTFLISENKAISISDFPGTWEIKEIEGAENLLLQGNYNGLSVLHYHNEQWSLRNKIDGFDISSRFFEFIAPNELLVNHEYKGVYKIKVDDNFTQIIGLDKEAPQGTGASLVKHESRILYSSDRGIFAYNDAQFKLDTLLTKAFFMDDEHPLGILVSDPYSKGLWGFAEHNILIVAPDKFKNSPKTVKIAVPSSFRKSMGVLGFESLTFLKDQHYLIGTSNGYITIDLSKIEDKNYSIHIDAVFASFLATEERPISLTTETEFKSNENNLRFFYSVPEYDKYTEVNYQYKLVGLYNEWSKWSTTPETTFNNLPHGAYTFMVRAQIGNTFTVNEGIYEFEIAKPWYLSPWAILTYIGCGIFMLIGVHKIYKAYYRKQQELLVKENKKKVKRKKLKAMKKIVQVENEKLAQEIDSKNRELAVSTMSLIKKNEFLNAVKDQLKNLESKQQINSVIRTIDRNINNEDDWLFFETAFNNADKDFLKKIKQLHPDLTPNDLKLCAYLRLNLASKEIAPLLNISAKSVEVKRYRLRKKMELPHETSLTNYILEL
ncbi:triple tyrosine motif-containing protein [Arenibacter sp. GZD96]|uniref:helix-turn-helix and ligand-binding sensor domain-containing protein n=1 Tax=Aurantibrevibacter litoralis TaxID=3106030 RepID=UPI002AFF1B8D|nr:triple tyrosine motif-containing protein [Arenibacter sp. GZD-96]MEA1784524.1 triple tyrosine motif-containing protein [Arenibacter sp. GZD-96]